MNKAAACAAGCLCRTVRSIGHMSNHPFRVYQSITAESRVRVDHGHVPRGHGGWIRPSATNSSLLMLWEAAGTSLLPCVCDCYQRRSV